MKRTLLPFLILVAATFADVRAETETIDLKALARKARPAVMLLVVSDAAGKEIATGTGFLVSSDGKLITNHHVIDNAASAVAKAENGGLFPIEGVLADDPKNDLVVLKLKAKDLPFLTLSTSATAEVGTRIAVIGSPLGLEGTLSEGIVSAFRDLEKEQRMLQITAAISPGSSGSPVLNARGEVVGVAAALVREGQALNFAVPTERVKVLVGESNHSKTVTPLTGNAEAHKAAILTLFRDKDYWESCEASRRGDYAQALRLIKLVQIRYPEIGDVYIQMGRIYTGLGFREEAKVAYDTAISVSKRRIDARPDDDSAWSSLGEIYATLGKYPEAIIAYKQAVTIAPSPIYWAALGGTYENGQNHSDAITAYRKAIKLMEERLPGEPFVALYWQYLGDAHSQAGEFTDAVVAYKQVTKFWPRDSEAWVKLAIALHYVGRMDEANDAFRRSRNTNTTGVVTNSLDEEATEAFRGLATPKLELSK